MDKGKRYSGTVLLENARDSQIDSPATISGSWQEGSRRVELSGPTHVEPSGQYITADDVLRAARAQGTLLRYAEPLTFADGPELQAFHRGLAEAEAAAPVVLDGISEAHVDIYYPATYAIRDGIGDGDVGIYDSSGQPIATRAGARAHGYSYILSVLNCTNTSIEVHRTDAVEPYYEINGPRYDGPDVIVLV